MAKPFTKEVADGEEVMRVVSLNVGLPRTVRWKGRDVTTGIFKEPVEDRVPLRRLNLDGDRQADLSVHGGAAKAVYAYPLEHYAFWREQLGEELPFGAFGENLTVERLPLEEEVAVGDRFRIGTAELVVTQPRLPCYKLGLRFGREDMVKRFLASRRTGYYLAVGVEGDVGAGDHVAMIARDPAQIPVAEITRVFASAHEANDPIRHRPDDDQRRTSMSTTTTETVRNGVDTEQLFGTLDAIKADPPLAKFQFRARNRWIDGAHNRTTIRDFYAAKQEDTSRAAEFVLDAGEPAILLGTDTGPNPAEYLLHALGACLTTSLVYVAAARGVHLTEVESTLEGDMDVQGALGLSDEYRNGFEQIRVSFRVKGDAPEEKLRALVARAQQRSAVFDIVTNGIPVAVDVATG